MENKNNSEIMHKDFTLISAGAGLKEAFEAIQKNLEGAAYSPDLVVLDEQERCAGVLTVDDFSKELGMLYHDACDQSGKRDWADSFFNQCEIAGVRKVSEIMSGKDATVAAGDDFDTACQLILGHNLKMVPVVDKGSQVVGIITREKILQELGPKMFR